MVVFQASVSKGWLHDHGGFIFDKTYYMNPLYRLEQDKKMNQLTRKIFNDYPIYPMEANLMQAPFVNDRQVLVGGIQPNLILAVLAGSKFVFPPDKDSDVVGQPLQNLENINALPTAEDVLSHPLIKQFDENILRIQKDYPNLEVIPPFFWDNSGRATIHGIITTSFKLIGDEAMMMIFTNPDLLKSIHEWITDIYFVLIEHYSQLAKLPVTSVHVGECSGTMISNEQYLEFIIPYVDQLGEKFGNIRMHSCGSSDHILDAITGIKNLSVIDTGSNTSVKKIREMKGPEFEINLEPPVKLMLKNASANDMLAWLNLTLEENDGGPLKIALHLESGYNTENCLLLYDELKKRNLVSDVSK